MFHFTCKCVAFVLLFVALNVPAALFAQEDVVTNPGIQASGLPQVCAPYYTKGSVVMVLEPSVRQTVPDTPLTFTGKLLNQNQYPIVDATLMMRVFRAEASGKMLVEQVSVLENLAVGSKSEKELSFTWTAPRSSKDGEYVAEFALVSADAYTIIDFGDNGNVTGNKVPFTITNDTAPGTAEFVASSVMLNGKTFDSSAQTSVVVTDDVVKIEVVLKNESTTKKVLPLQWNQYAWSSASKENIRNTKTEVVELAAGEAKTVSYEAAPQSEGVVDVVVITQDGDSKSIVPITYQQEGGLSAEVVLASLNAVPLLKDGVYTATACVRNVQPLTGDQYSVEFLIKDSNGDNVSQYEQNLAATSSEIVTHTFTPTKSSNTATMTVTLKHNGAMVTQVTQAYDCNSVGGECVPEEAGYLDDLSAYLMYFVGALAFVVLVTLFSIYSMNKRKNNIVVSLFIGFVTMIGAFSVTADAAYAQSCLYTGGPNGTVEEIVDGCANGLGYYRPWDFTDAFVVVDPYGNYTICHDNVSIEAQVCWSGNPPTSLGGFGSFEWSGTGFGACQGSIPACTSTTPPPPSNTPPDAPVITGPATGVPNTSYTFNMSANDSDGNNVRYGVDWNNDSAVDQWLPGAGYVGSGASQSAARSWGADGAYTFQVLTEDDVGARSGWASHTISIASPLPSGGCTVTEVFKNDVDGFVDMRGNEICQAVSYISVADGGTGVRGNYRPCNGPLSDGQYSDVGSCFGRIDLFPDSGPAWRCEAYAYHCEASVATADLKINNSDTPITAVRGATLTLNWTSSNAVSCTKFGANWGSGEGVAVSGSETVSATVSDTYLINCGGTIDSIAVTVVNQGPNAPVITHPTGTADFGVNTTFTIAGTDPDNDVVFYEIDWDNNGTVDATSASVPSGTGVSAIYGWSATGAQTLQARTVDTAAARSGWTQYTITINNPPAATATLEASVNGGGWSTADQTVNTTDTVALRWSSSNATNCSGTGSGFSVSGTSGSDTVNTPAANASESFQITCSGPGGSSNDSLTITTRQLPNLSQPNILYTLGAFNTTTGMYDSVNITFQTSNNGGSDTTTNASYSLEFDRGGNGYDQTVNGSLGTLAVGQVFTGSEVVNGNIPLGSSRIRVTVDSTNAVTETNETDNVRTLDINAGSPDPGLSLTANPSRVQTGQSATIAWSIANPYDMNCSVFGPGLTTINFNPTSGSSGSTSVGPLASKSEYTIRCVAGGAIFIDTVSVEAEGILEEI